MNHKHLNLQESLELRSGDRQIPQETGNCGICKTRISKADFLLKKLRDKELSPVNEIFGELRPGVNVKEDFLSFINSSSLANPKENKHLQEQKQNVIKFRYTRYIAAGLLAACMLVVVNFKYYLIFPKEKYINASTELNISRKGLLAGKTGLISNSILPGFDEASNESDDTIIESGRGMKLFVIKMSRFGFMEKNNIFSVSLYRGRYFIDFEAAGKGYTVELPLNSRVTITGTQIYFDVNEMSCNIYIKEGKAGLQIDNKRTADLEAGFRYEFSENKKLTSHRLSAEDSAELLNQFSDMEGFNTYLNRNGQKPEESHINKNRNPSSMKRLTISELKKKYGTLSVITTKDNKKYIGAFRITGNKIEIITTGGKITLPSSKVKNLSPYGK